MAIDWSKPLRFREDHKRCQLVYTAEETKTARRLLVYETPGFAGTVWATEDDERIENVPEEVEIWVNVYCGPDGVFMGSRCWPSKEEALKAGRRMPTQTCLVYKGPKFLQPSAE